MLVYRSHRLCLIAMGVNPVDAIGAVRLSLGRPTTGADVERAAKELAAATRRLRASGVGFRAGVTS